MQVTLRLAVAASGGADSTALIAEAAATFSPSEVVVLSVDHGTRASAAVERAHAGAVARKFGFAFSELAIGAVPQNQAAWRKARLDALLGFCEAQGIPRLWLGQHREDAVETAALRCLAGGNLRASAGISAARNERGVRIERPLLSRSARAIRRDLMARKLCWYEDPSNRNVGYRRVAVRRLLTQTGGYRHTNLVGRTGQWRSDYERLLERAWWHVSYRGDMGSLWLRPEVLHALPRELAAFLVRRAALMVVGREQRLRKVAFERTVERCPSVSQLGGARTWMLDGSWLMGRDYRHIQHRIPLSPGKAVFWDARYELRLGADLGFDGMLAGRLGLLEARKRSRELPAEWLAASLAIWCDTTLVAAPDLGVWVGELGAQLHDVLEWQRAPCVDSGVFRVAP